MGHNGMDEEEEDGGGARRSSGNRDGGGGGGSSSRPCFPLDRSKVRILLCDKDARSSEEVLQLLYRCSYQVTSVKTARQVIEVLNTQGSDIDIILSEVDIPITKAFKMLKHIIRDKELRRIPIIMMSAQDEVSVVAKCLRLGAADYLVKPLRTNELLNLWTHMWRRRRMLGLPEKDVFANDFELALSDPSDANTNSTNLLSDETEDKQCVTTYPDRHEHESNSSAVEPSYINPKDNEPIIQEDIDQRRVFSRPKKTDLKFGACSAFLTYIKSVPTGNSLQPRETDQNTAPLELSNVGHNYFDNGMVPESCHRGNGFTAAENPRDMNAFQTPMEFPVVRLSSSSTHPQSRSEAPTDVARVPSIFPVPIFVQGMIEQSMMPPMVQMFQAHTSTSMLPQYNNVLPQCPIPSFSYNPVGVHHQPGQMSAPRLWPSSTSSPLLPPAPVKSGWIERRAAALIKFRQKRKDRCFDKKIRYVNRKQLAERRPRVRGQFVRQVDGSDAPLNGFIGASGDSEKDEDE